MNYNNDSVRRQDRLLSEEEAVALLRVGEFGVLSMVSEQSGGYGIPLSFAFDGEVIYFHCAPEGEKLKALAANNRVSFCVIGKTRVIPNQFTTAYESVLVNGTVALDLSDSEKLHALELILDKYSPDDKAVGMKYAEKSFQRPCVIRLDIASVSGKCKVTK